MDDDVRVTLRLPDDVHKDIVEIATSEDRSLNQQIVHFLRLKIADWKRKP